MEEKQTQAQTNKLNRIYADFLAEMERIKIEQSKIFREYEEKLSELKMKKIREKI